MAELLDRLTAALSDRYAIDEEIGAGGIVTVISPTISRNSQCIIGRILV